MMSQKIDLQVSDQETWAWPLSPEHRALLDKLGGPIGAIAQTGGSIGDQKEVVAFVGPICGPTNLLITVPVTPTELEQIESAAGDDGAFSIRWGIMTRDQIRRVPEHEGW